MKRVTACTTAAVLALLWTCAVSAAPEAPTIEMKSEAVVDGEAIVLRNVAELPEDAAERLGDLELGNAPWPGHHRRVSRALVRVRMASRGFRPDRYEFAGAERCRVAVAEKCIGSKKLLSAARGFLRDRFRGTGDVTIASVAEPRPVQVRAGEGDVEIEPGIDDRRRGRGEVSVGLDIVRGGKLLEHVAVRFRVTRRRKVLVAAERIGRGKAPQSGAVKLQTRDVARLSGSPLTSPAQLRNTETVRAIPAGQVVTKDMVKERRDPIVVRANERVRLVVERGSLRVSTIGRALSTARKGEEVKAENVRTNQRISGVATGSGRIQVNIGGYEP